jgi:hypothetical protein
MPVTDETMCMTCEYRVVEQFVGQGLVFLFVCPPRPRPGDGEHLGLPRLRPHQHLGRGPHERQRIEIEVEQIRRRVDLPKGAVQVEAVALERRPEPLGQHDLEDVAALDVVFGRLYRLFEGRALYVGGEVVLRPFHGRRGLGWLRQVCFQGVEARLGVRIRIAQIRIVVNEHVGHEHQLMAHMVEGGHSVVEAPHRVGEAQVVGGGVGEVLHEPYGIVPHVAHGAAAQPGKIRGLHLFVSVHVRVQHLEDGAFGPGEASLRPRGASLAHLHGGPKLLGCEDAIRISAKKRVAGQLFAALHAFEQEAVRGLLAEGQVRRYRREKVGAAAGMHRYHEPRGPCGAGGLDLGAKVVERHGTRACAKANRNTKPATSRPAAGREPIEKMCRGVSAHAWGALDP